jgi:Transposase IS4
LSVAIARFLHGCNVLYDLVKPWANTNAIVVADSYFASVQLAIRLMSIGMRFIGTIKTATKEFPMKVLGAKPMMGGKGDRYGLLSKDVATGTDLLAVLWIDRDRRYFISTVSSLSAGNPCFRQRWRQEDQTANAEPVMRDIVIQQPEVCEIYYSACGKIDRHNRFRQASLMLETKLNTIVWHRRVNNSIFGMIVVDAYLLAVGCQGAAAWPTSGDFFTQLAEDLIENKYEARALRRREQRVDNSLAAQKGLAMAAPVAALPAAMQLVGATPTKRRKRAEPTNRAQGRCMACKLPCSTVCRTCQHWQPDPKGTQFWICNKAGMGCMGDHILAMHPDQVRGGAEGI